MKPDLSNENPTVDQVVRVFTGTLRTWKNSTRARTTQKYFKHDVVALGIDTPTLRAFVKDQVKPLKKVWTLDQAVACCDRLSQEPELEVIVAGFLVLGAFKKDYTEDLTSNAEQWLKGCLNNWALVDGFCSAVLSPLLEKCPEIEETLCVWSKDESLWVRRAALVTFIPFARRGRYLDRAYRLTREHLADREDLMHKAEGWLLREAGKTDMERLRQFLLKHGPAIPRTTVRYAIERFPTEDRAELLQRTRSIKGTRNRQPVDRN